MTSTVSGRHGVKLLMKKLFGTWLVSVYIDLYKKEYLFI